MSGAGVAVPFGRRDSIYKKIAGCDVYDADRNALSFDGSCPVVAHPPCRAWGRLKGCAKPDEGEKELSPWAVEMVQRNGGVLEHPAGSTLWRSKKLPRPTQAPDKFGGYTIHINQSDFGHRAQKATWLYIVGCPMDVLPRPKIELGFPDRTVTQLGRAAREHTPEKLARWLVEVAMSRDRKNRLAAHGQLAMARPDLHGHVEPGADAGPHVQMNLF